MTPGYAGNRWTITPERSRGWYERRGAAAGEDRPLPRNACRFCEGVGCRDCRGAA